jgi:hypothetical protein
MTIENFGLVEHFDYMKKYIPQPFVIKSSDVLAFKKEDSGTDSDYIIETISGKYTLTRSSLKKLVDSLGVKVKLLNAVCDETDVIDLALPIIDKLFKCFSDCFVFYNTNMDPFAIIDLNINNEKGEEGTKYENGPSPWKIDVNKNPSAFTCFVDFLLKYSINKDNTDICVKADDIMMNDSTVMFKLLKHDYENERLQPMLIFSSKFSNMNGFSNINVGLYDTQSDIYILFPMNYAKLEGASFEDLWKKAIHIYSKTDLNDYICVEINELAASSDTPNVIKNFISSVLTDSTVNLNQSINDILNESCTVMTTMKPSKAKKFKKALGSLIACALCMKHHGCSECGHLDLNSDI